MNTDISAIRGIGAPAQRALAAAGYQTLESLNGVDYPDLLSLHGVGARGLERLQGALQERGMSLRGATTETTPRNGVVTEGHTGVTAKDVKTSATDVNPVDYVATLDTPRRVEHGQLLLDIFGRVTGAEPVMWGPSMIGYGEVHYRYDTGREGDWFKVGFSPRKAKISLYGLTDAPSSAEFLTRLGKHTVGASCLYINKPEDIDLDVLEEMIAAAWN